MSGSPVWIGSHKPSKAASSSSGVPQSSSPARAFGDSNTATWLNMSPPRSGYCTKWHPGPTYSTTSVSDTLFSRTISMGTAPR